jgi:hypothetical protein
MTKPLEMPDSIQKVCDRVVSATLDNAPMHNDIGLLQRWLEIDGWDMIADTPETFLIDFWEFDYFTDDWVTSEFLDWAPEPTLDSDNITDQDRLKWARHICASIDDDHTDDDWGCLFATAHPISLTSTNGTSAVLGCVLLSLGNGDFDVQWHGAWQDEQSFIESLQKSDRYRLHDHLHELTDEEILAMWS